LGAIPSRPSARGWGDAGRSRQLRPKADLWASATGRRVAADSALAGAAVRSSLAVFAHSSHKGLYVRRCAVARRCRRRSPPGQLASRCSVAGGLERAPGSRDGWLGRAGEPQLSGPIRRLTLSPPEATLARGPIHRV
jgi:hypothetical protein